MTVMMLPGGGHLWAMGRKQRMLPSLLNLGSINYLLERVCIKHKNYLTISG
jgi:hypothetical protein